MGARPRRQRHERTRRPPGHRSQARGVRRRSRSLTPDGVWGRSGRQLADTPSPGRIPRRNVMPAQIADLEAPSLADAGSDVTPQEAAAMLRAALTLFDRWKLTPAEARRLLGEPS